MKKLLCVLDIKSFIQIDGYDENYTALTGGIALMPKLGQS
jgi:hypothetical protein